MKVSFAQLAEDVGARTPPLIYLPPQLELPRPLQPLTVKQARKCYLCPPIHGGVLT